MKIWRILLVICRIDKITLLLVMAGNLAVKTLSKIVLTIRISANNAKHRKCEIFGVEKMFRMSSVTLHLLVVKLFLKLRTALFGGFDESCPISFPVWLTLNSEIVLGFGWRFQNILVRRSADMLCSWHSIKIWRVITWPLFLFYHLWTVLIETLLRDKCNARRALCIAYKLTAVGYTLQWNWKQKLTNNFSFCLQQHCH